MKVLNKKTIDRSESLDSLMLTDTHNDNHDHPQNFALILPVLFYEYLAMSIARSLIPSLLVEAYGKQTYLGIIYDTYHCY